jgi:NAD(P)H-quinone oxidoreductase subunit 5
MLNWIGPAGCLLAAVLASWRPRRAWQLAQMAAGLLFLATAASAVAGTDALSATVGLLVAFLGWVVVRFSLRYLAGEPGQSRYVSALLVTLAAVATLVQSTNLGVSIAAWVVVSLGLHRLLTFYGDRPGAALAAHKKFLASRLAEACLLAAAWLLYREVGSLSFADLNGQAAAGPLSPGLDAAAVLLVVAVILKSAQLPIHGWLIQVMEAPTPVSALLHAGVVNIGGFVLIRLAPLVHASPLAEGLLVVVGGLSALLAGLVMMTRISIKVRLAWSTCAQMGFMLMEIGLGLYELALLHLVAHSLYKAHAFLSCGDTVVSSQRRELAGLPGRSSLSRRLAALGAAFALIAVTAGAWQRLAGAEPASAVALFILAMGLAPLLWTSAGSGKRAAIVGTGRLLALAQVYFLWHQLFADLAPGAETPSPWLAAWAVLCLGALYLLQGWLAGGARTDLTERLRSWAYAGFYLDEMATRLSLRLWPVALPEGQFERPQVIRFDEEERTCRAS